MANYTYFARDGSYGDAGGILIINTEDWSDDDWAAIDNADCDELGSTALDTADTVDVFHPMDAIYGS